MLCSACGRFYRAAPGGSGAGPGTVREPLFEATATAPAIPAPALMRAATYGGMGEIEAHLTELGIPFQRVSDTSLQVVRQLGPQTVNLTIDSARNIHIHSASGVQDLTLSDSSATRLYFDPNWKERYDFDLALEDKTFALINTSGSDLPEVPDDLPPPESTGKTERLPLLLEPAITGSSMAEALGNVPPPRADPPTAPLEATISAAPVSRPLRGDEDSRTPLPVPSVILPATPDGKPPVLAPSPAPAPAAARPPPASGFPELPARPSGVHVSNGTSRDVIERPISARVEREDTPPPVALKRVPTPASRPAVELGGVRTPSETARAALGDPAAPRAPSDPGRAAMGPIRTPSETARAALGDPAAPRTPTDASLRQPIPRTPTDPSQRALGPRVPTDPSRQTLDPRPSGEPATVPEVPLLRPALDPRPSGEPATIPDTAPRPIDVSALDTITSQVIRPRRDAGRREREEEQEQPADQAPRGRLGAGWVLVLGLAAGLALGTLVSAPPALLQALPWRPAAAKVREGNAAVRRGDLDAAVARYREAVKLDPRSAAAWRNLGAAYALRGDQLQSTEAYRKYLELARSPEEARAVRELIGEK